MSVRFSTVLASLTTVLTSDNLFPIGKKRKLISRMTWSGAAAFTTERYYSRERPFFATMRECGAEGQRGGRPNRSRSLSAGDNEDSGWLPGCNIPESIPGWRHGEFGKKVNNKCSGVALESQIVGATERI